jgi:hypothetical protein
MQLLGNLIKLFMIKTHKTIIGGTLNVLNQFSATFFTHGTPNFNNGS